MIIISFRLGKLPTDIMSIYKRKRQDIPGVQRFVQLMGHVVVLFSDRIIQSSAYATDQHVRVCSGRHFEWTTYLRVYA